ncbi:hypothetical protein BGW80DRAFT_499185 [Lactifluus volemus]|nr:hypothetical protein BGW80DRAFT_499185 [Lactifluus volemus]
MVDKRLLRSRHCPPFFLSTLKSILSNLGNAKLSTENKHIKRATTHSQSGRGQSFSSLRRPMSGKDKTESGGKKLQQGKKKRCIQTTGKLLGDIYTGEYLRRTTEGAKVFGRRGFKNKAMNWSRDLPSKYIQDLCVTRICRCLCLLEENISYLRKDVVRTMKSLATIQRPESTGAILVPVLPTGRV